MTGRYCFSLTAVSKFGVASAPYELEVAIESKVPQTRTTLTSKLDLTVGEKNQLLILYF